MRRRQYLGGLAAGAATLAGCSASLGDGDATDTVSGTPTPAERSFGDLVDVTEYGATAPVAVRFAPELVFSARSDTIRWTPGEGRRFLLVRIRKAVVATGEADLAPFPDAEPYSVRADGTTYQERPAPERTNAMEEPVRGGYATDGGRGAEGAATYGWLGFEVPDSVSAAGVRVRYERPDDRPVLWVASANDVVTPTPAETDTGG